MTHRDAIVLLFAAALMPSCSGTFAAGPTANSATGPAPLPCQAAGILELQHRIIRKACAPRIMDVRLELATSGRSGRLWTMNPDKEAEVSGTVRRVGARCAVELTLKSHRRVGGFDDPDRRYTQDVVFQYRLTVQGTQVSGEATYREVGAAGEDDVCNAPLHVEGSLAPHPTAGGSQ